MRTRTTIVAVMLLGATATACSGTIDDKASAAAAGSTGTGSTGTGSTGTPTTSVGEGAKAGPLRIGTGRHWSDIDTDGSPISATTTVLSYTQPAKGVRLPDAAADFSDPVWATLEVKVCADSDSTNVMVGQTPWSLGFADDTRLAAPGLSGSGVPKPEYPADGAAVRPGSCLRGKITYSLEKGTRPNQVIYGVEGRDPIEWTIPKA